MQKKRFIILAIVLILFLVNLLMANRASILTAKANFYFKKNNMTLAQKNFEKAFELGVKDSKNRNVYINSIINSPLTIDAQYKLIKFLDYPVEDGAKVRVQLFLQDLKHEIHKTYPDNYIANAVYNQKILRWNKFPIKYGFINQNLAPEYFVREIIEAFGDWEHSTGRKITFLRDDEHPDIIVNFLASNPADENQFKYVVAYTAPVVNANTLTKMHVNFYLKDPQKNFFTRNQVYNTALHEIGHALGFMGHCNDRDNIMYLTKDSTSVLEDSRMKLSDADINTMKFLYDIKPDITNCVKKESKFLLYLALGTEYEINNAKIAEARRYIRKAPNLPSGYVDLAEVYASNKDYPKAIRMLEKALQIADSEEIRGMISYNLAVCYYSIDHLQMAKQYLKQALKVSSADEYYYLLSEIYTKEGNTKGAIKELNKLVLKNPNNIEYAIALTNIYVVQKKFISARKVLKRHIKNNPNDKNNPRFAPYGILNFFL